MAEFTDRMWSLPFDITLYINLAQYLILSTYFIQIYTFCFLSFMYSSVLFVYISKYLCRLAEKQNRFNLETLDILETDDR